MTDEEVLSPERVAAVAQAARDTLGCKAIVIVAIGDELARTAVARDPDHLDSDAADQALTTAAGSIALARMMEGQQLT